jgi:hypothetical protein
VDAEAGQEVTHAGLHQAHPPRSQQTQTRVTCCARAHHHEPWHTRCLSGLSKQSGWRAQKNRHKGTHHSSSFLARVFLNQHLTRVQLRVTCTHHGRGASRDRRLPCEGTIICRGTLCPLCPNPPYPTASSRHFSLIGRLFRTRRLCVRFGVGRCDGPAAPRAWAPLPQRSSRLASST